MTKPVCVNREGAKSAKGTESMGRREPGPELEQLTRDVIGAAIEVHRVLGPGLLESAYEKALCIELGLRNLSFLRRPAVNVSYKEHVVGVGRLDLLVGGAPVVELKAVETLAPVHHAQVISYLKTTGHQLALLINFNVPRLKEGIKRIICT